MPRHTAYLALLLLASCWGVKDNALFESSAGPVSGADASAASSFGASSGTDSGSGATANGAAATNGAAPASEVAGGGGSGHGGSEVVAGGGVAGAQQAPVEVPVITDCAMVERASVGENGHCYRVNLDELTYAQASEACAAAGGHLVTIASEQENELAEQLHDGVHWIGASDGREDTMPGVGTYTWIDGSPWEYSWWEDGQPNAYETNCPDQGDESDCFEHCAFQTDEGDWNDRSCWHTIASICEWDVEAEPPVEGSAGADSDES